MSVDAYMKHTGIRRETLFDKFVEKFTHSELLVKFKDIDFESNEFSKKFYVWSEDKSFAYRLITPMVMEFFLRNDKYSAEFFRNAMILYGNTYFSKEDFKEAMRFGVELVGILPRYIDR